MDRTDKIFAIFLVTILAGVIWIGIYLYENGKEMKQLCKFNLDENQMYMGWCDHSTTKCKIPKGYIKCDYFDDETYEVGSRVFRKEAE